MSKLRSVQVLRGVAACAVVFLHARYFSPQPIDHSVARLGAAGVDLFFVISGFIMTSLPKPSAKMFLFDRFWRIFPMWWLAVTPFLLVAGARTWPTLLSSITLWPIYGRFTPQALSVGWTLSFELLFYAAVALATKTRPAVALALFGCALVTGIVTGWPLFRFTGNPIILEFLMGAAVARMPRHPMFGFLLIPGIAAFCVAPLAMYGADVAVDSAVSWLRVMFWGLPAALIFCGCLNLERVFAHRVFRIPELLGNASYSIYLFHVGVLRLLPAPPALAFSLAILAGVFIWRFVERPILRLKPMGPRWRKDAHQASSPAAHISKPNTLRPSADQTW